MLKLNVGKFRLSLGTKLVGLLAVLLLGSVLSLDWISTRLFVESDTALIQQTNSDSAANLATQMRELFQNITEKMRILGAILLSDEQRAAQKLPPTLPAGENIISEFFLKDHDFLAVFLMKRTPPFFALTGQAFSPDMAALGDPQGSKTVQEIVEQSRDSRELSLPLVAEGESQITTMNLSDGEAALVVAIPFVQDPTNPKQFSHILISVIRQSRFVKAFSESEIITSFMVDRHGTVVAHPDAEIVHEKEDFSKVSIVQKMLEGKFNNGQTQYEDPLTHEAKLGAFKTVGFGGLGVVAEVAEAKAFEAAHRVEYRAALVAWIVLCLAFLAGYLYSATITIPVRRLSEAAHRISEGDFKINLRVRGQDEIAHLSGSFNEMAKGLEERDRVKETFNKFHNKEIAEKLLSGDVKLGGERKEATVFFSDVRGFTALSESMEPELVVELLNEYMTRMVAIIRKHGGVVDKYVGDAIMALWGVPLTTPHDTYNAVKACLDMREGLAELNSLRISRGQPVLKIGMGLNTGPLIAGNIGSNEKMEYTVIGDAVNLASRIESMTKEFGTDLLISKSIHEKIKDSFTFETGGSTFVKGKSEAIEVYKVTGYIDDAGKPVLVETPYSSYTAEKSDKVVHADPVTGSHKVATQAAAVVVEPATGSRKISAQQATTVAVVLEPATASRKIVVQPTAAVALAVEPATGSRKISAQPAAAVAVAVEPVTASRKIVAQPAAEVVAVEPATGSRKIEIQTPIAIEVVEAGTGSRKIEMQSPSPVAIEIVEPATGSRKITLESTTAVEPTTGSRKIVAQEPAATAPVTLEESQIHLDPPDLEMLSGQQPEAAQETQIITQETQPAPQVQSIPDAPTEPIQAPKPVEAIEVVERTDVTQVLQKPKRKA